MNTYHSEEIYTLEIYNGRSGGDRDVFVDLLITSATENTKEIYLASISGSDSDVNQVNWLMTQGGKAGRFRRAEGKAYEDGFIQSRVLAHPRKNRYTVHATKVGDVTHSLLVSKAIEPKLKERQDWQAEQEKANIFNQMLPDHLAEMVIAWDGDYKTQIYKVLMDRFGTPMIEDWKDYIVDVLIEEGYYKPLNVYTFGIENPVEAGLIKVTETQLENIISDGIKAYDLDFALLEDPTQEDILSNISSIDEYLTHFAGDLGQCIQDNIKVDFDPKVDDHHPAFRDVNLTANENGLTGLFPPQADTVMGVAKTLQRSDYSFVVGEMG